MKRDNTYKSTKRTFWTAAGFLVFLIGACKVYYNKLAKKGAVTGGLYKYIRHPQYAAFIVCSFGLLLVWPRYIVAVMFVTMLFAYYLLARVEEKECIAKFGESYSSYMEHTNLLTICSHCPAPTRTNRRLMFY